MFYSRSTGGFYTQDVHGDNIPGDCVEINSDAYQQLMNGQGSGKRITADTNGFPVLSDIPPPSQQTVIEEKLAALDVDNMLSQSDLRKFILLTVKAVQELNPALDLTVIPGVAKVVEVEAQAEALRAQL